MDQNLEGGKKRSLFPEENKLVLSMKYPVEGVFLFWESRFVDRISVHRGRAVSTFPDVREDVAVVSRRGIEITSR